MVLAPASLQIERETMPAFKYLGLPESQRQNIIDTHMAPLMIDDEELKHPRLGGFPLPKLNEESFYENTKDKIHTRKDKARRRDEYRADRVAELEAEMAEADARMVFTIGRVIGREGSGKELVFPKGEVVEVNDRHKGLVETLRAMCGQEVIKRNADGKIVKQGVVVDEPLFEEITIAEGGPIEEEEPEAPAGPPWGDRIPTRQEFVEYLSDTMKKSEILEMEGGLDASMNKAELLTVIHVRRYGSVG